MISKRVRESVNMPCDMSTSCQHDIDDMQRLCISRKGHAVVDDVERSDEIDKRGGCC